jgi:D-galacturonate reductase
MFFEGPGKTGMIKHNDQFRGVEHSYLEGIGCGGSHFNYVSPDFYKLVPWEGDGYKPVGYGYESVAASVSMAEKIENTVKGMTDDESLLVRRKLIREVDDKGIIATPANSYINELVVEAARISIIGDGIPVSIEYGNNPHVKPRL